MQWFDLDAPESAEFPGKYKEGLTDLQSLMLLRCFRVDRVYRAITNFVTGRMGEQFVTPPVVSLESVYDQSSPFSPIVFILSPGADPAGELGKLADIKGYGGNRFKFLAMGQGQEKVCQFDIQVYFDEAFKMRMHFLLGGSSTSGNGIHPWALADVAKLSSTYSLAQRA